MNRGGRCSSVEVVRRHVTLTPQAARLIKGEFAQLFRNPTISGGTRKPAAAKSEPATDPILSTQEAADLVGVSRPYIVARIEAGDIPLHQQVGNPRRVLQSAVLAWHRSGQVGIALQAEHDSAEDRAAAPLVAQFDGHRLTMLPASCGLAGYAGDIVATDAGYAVGATRADRNVTIDLTGHRTADVPLLQACAQSEAWSMGLQLLHRSSGRQVALPAGLRPDNHAMSWAS